ncbi:MAG: hypothetical protein ACI4W1_02380 [Ruminococcus sp.]
MEIYGKANAKTVDVHQRRKNQNRKIIMVKRYLEIFCKIARLLLKEYKGKKHFV